MKYTLLSLVALATAVYAGLPPKNSIVSVIPLTNFNIAMRHCNYIVQATPIETSDDFNFKLVNALNGDSNAVSFQSTNFPDHYLSIIDGQDGGFAERGRLGIVTTPDVYNASWVIVSGLADPTNFSIVSQSRTPMFTGKYITLSNKNSGGCNYSPPSGDMYVDDQGNGVTQTWIIGQPPPPPPPAPATVTIDVASGPDHKMNDWFMGCHTDPGYTQEPRGWYSQLVYGESFEQGTTKVFAWNDITSSNVVATVQLDSNVNVNPNRIVPSLSITYTSGNGVAGWANRGIGNEGMYIVGGQLYDGYVIVLAPQGASLFVGVNDYTQNSMLASTTINVPASSSWQQVNFTLTPSAGTVCTGITPGSNPKIDCGNMGPNPGHICVQCGGELQVGLNNAGSAHIGYVFFEPGPWGRVNNLPVLKSAGDTMTQMGIKVIRQGGTVSQSFRWKDWRGTPWLRGSMQHVWGDSLVSGWGPFEFFDMCAALNIEPVITLAYDLNNATDFADLVEYCYGDATTYWGNMRINVDNHPAPYNVHTFELGNEQENPNYVQQVTAMEARRAAVNAPPLFYMYPTNSGVSASVAQQIINAGLPVQSILPDCHVGGGGGISCAESDFNNLPNFDQSFINCETNAAISSQLRAIQESSDLQTWFNVREPVLHRLRARTASFCTERSGHYDAFDQGISFFLPNMTWLQPPGWVHAMITQNWLPNALNISITGGSESFPASSSQISDDGKTVVLQVVNPVFNADNATLTINFLGFTPSTSVNVWTLEAPGLPSSYGNPPSNPTLISPVQTMLSWPSGASSMNVSVPAGSFVIYSFTSA